MGEIADVIKFKKMRLEHGVVLLREGLFNLEGNLSCGRKIDICKNRRKKENPGRI